MKLFRRSRNLLRATKQRSVPSSQLTRYSIDVDDQSLRGWLRLQFEFDENVPQEIGIEALAPPESEYWSAKLSGPKFSCFVFVPSGSASIRLWLDYSSGQSNPRVATVQPVSLLEYAYHSLDRSHWRQASRLLRFFYSPPPEMFVISEFPHPDRVLDSPYQKWISNHEARAVERYVLPRSIISRRPPISILLCLRSGPGTLGQIKRIIASVVRQSEQDWQLYIVGRAGVKPAVRRFLAKLARKDGRISVRFPANCESVAKALNSALASVSAPYLVRVDQASALPDFAIEACTQFLENHPDCEILCSDEDTIDRAGRRSKPLFKPGKFAPELFHSFNYFGKFTVYRTESVRAAGGWRSGFDGAEDYDLNLRLLPNAATVHHLPLVLYHRGRDGESPNNDNVTESGKRALADYFRTRKIDAEIETIAHYLYRVRYGLPKPLPSVSILIPFRDQPELLQRCVSSILEKSTYPNFEVVLINNDSVEPQTLALLDSYKESPRIRLAADPRPFNYSALNNLAARNSRGTYFCFLNSDIEVITPDWLEDMVGYASQSDVGCVGAKLYYGDGKIQHAGILVARPDFAGHAFRSFDRDARGYLNRLCVASNYAAVTGACLVVHRDKFWQVGGFDERLPITYNDVDLCLKLFGIGYRNVVTPFARLYHFEGSTRGFDGDDPIKVSRSQADALFMQTKYEKLAQMDPYYSPHLSPIATDFSVRQ
jgi:GT2 family glycosyltransferase